MIYDYLIVGAGYSGCVLAERISSQLGKKVLIVDKRNHIAGNAYDEYNKDTSSSTKSSEKLFESILIFFGHSSSSHGALRCNILAILSLYSGGLLIASTRTSYASSDT